MAESERDLDQILEEVANQVKAEELIGRLDLESQVKGLPHPCRKFLPAYLPPSLMAALGSLLAAYKSQAISRLHQIQNQHVLQNNGSGFYDGDSSQKPAEKQETFILDQEQQCPTTFSAHSQSRQLPHGTPECCMLGHCP